MKQGALYFAILIILLLLMAKICPEYVQVDGVVPVIIAVVSLLLLDLMIAVVGMLVIAWVGLGRWNMKMLIAMMILLMVLVFIANMVALNVMDNHLEGFYIPNIWLRVIIALFGVPSINININRE
ncbi:hypothetical protein IKG12_00960 [Candidatus Saccharibacteria bacterium]|nr:hypothetical protein [Candidatus Saccharibacteria bacterium]